MDLVIFLLDKMLTIDENKIDNFDFSLKMLMRTFFIQYHLYRKLSGIILFLR